MKRILKGLLILITIFNLIGMMLKGAIMDNINTTPVSTSIEKERCQKIKEKGVLTVASPLYDFPFFYIDNGTNKISGIDADIITEIAKRLGVNKVEMKETVFANLLEKLNTEDSLDMAVGGIYITPEREKLVTFTKSLYKESEVVVVPKFSDINFMNDLRESVVGVEKGTLFEGLAQKWKENQLIKDLISFENTSDLLSNVNSKKIDAGIADSVVVSNYLLNNKNLFLRTLQDYKPELPGNIGIAVRKNDSELLKQLNKIINEMKADGTIYSILVDYGLGKDNMIVN